jgi:hypothetical protein
MDIVACVLREFRTPITAILCPGKSVTCRWGTGTPSRMPVNYTCPPDDLIGNLAAYRAVRVKNRLSPTSYTFGTRSTQALSEGPRQNWYRHAVALIDANHWLFLLHTPIQGQTVGDDRGHGIRFYATGEDGRVHWDAGIWENIESPF